MNDLHDAYLFSVEMVLEWSKDLVPILTIEYLHLSDSMDANLALIKHNEQ